MLWLEVVKVLMKTAKKISRRLREEKSATDDTPHRITAEEYAMVITEELLDSVPAIVAIHQKRRK